MPTKEELEAENTALREQLDDMRDRLEEARDGMVPKPNTRPKPTEPSFGLSEGQRAELEMNGKTVSPFTGARQVGTGEPGADVSVVDQAEFDKVKKSESRPGV